MMQDPYPFLAALAALTGLMAAFTSMWLLDPRRALNRRPRIVRLGAAIAVFSTGVWIAQFISHLAQGANVASGFDVLLGILGLIASIAATGAAFTIWLGADGAPTRTAVSGLVLAAGVAAAPLTDILIFATAGGSHGQLALPAAFLASACVCVTAAMWLLARGNAGWAAVLLSLGVWLDQYAPAAELTLDRGVGAGSALPAAARLVSASAASGAGMLIMALAVAIVVASQRLSDRLAREAQRTRIVADATLDGLIFERHGQIVDVNRTMCELMKTEADRLIGRKLSDLVPALVELRLSECGNPIEYAVSLPDGTSVPVELSWQKGPDLGGHVVAIRDLSRVKAAEQKVERLAHVDPLTGLLNHDLFEQALKQALAGCTPAAARLGLLYIDVDRFDLITETAGHYGAEQILVQIAGRLSAVVPGTHSAARLGRDAFGLIQPLAEISDLAAVAQRILNEMATPFLVNGQPMAATVGIGVAMYPDDSTDAVDLLECAILASCQAKREGGGRWHRFQANMDLVVQQKRSLGRDLRIALTEKQFSLNYQPFVDTATLEVVGYEALLRWDHPDRGRISPADFIPIAEESGLIVPIGNWVLAAACAEAASWENWAIISVNLSPAQFIQPGIVGKVADALRYSGLPPSRLELEITEGTLMHDTRNALRILTALKALGVKIAMDDFGTGYSSLSYLRTFPFDKIKIDRSFISDAESGSDAETIVQAIIAMGRSLRLAVTAEGVETNQQLTMLRGLGCNFVQGYLLGRPCSADQLNLHAVREKLPRPAFTEPLTPATARVGPA